MEEKMDFNDFAPLMGLWADTFKAFIESKEMFDIYAKIKQDAKSERIVPASDNVFRSFSTSNPKNIKTIWYLMDPYPRAYPKVQGKPLVLQATGIPMDCSNSPDGKLQPSLVKFYDAMDKDLKKKVLRTPDLSYLLQQGVLLLNSDLTCIYKKTASHEGLWEKFQEYFLQEIVGSRIDIMYVLAGKASQKLEKYINPFCPIVKLEHPSFADRMHKDWESKNIFTFINKRLEQEKKEPIIWNATEYYAKIEKELPF